MLRRLGVTGYKSLTDVDIKFGDLSVIVGPNAAGKSNLFDAIGLLGRLASSQTLKEAFASHRGAPLEAFTVPEAGIQELSEQKSPSAEIRFEADIHLSDEVVQSVEREIRAMREGLTDARRAPTQRPRIVERDLRYVVVIEIKTNTGLLRVKDESVTPLRSDGQVNQSRRPFFEKVQHRLHLRMEGQSHPTYYDLGLDHTLLSRPLYAPHYPHITALREELSRWRVYYFDPESLRAESPLRHTQTIGLRGDDLAAYLNTLKTDEPKEFLSLVQALKFIVPAIDDIDIERTREGFLRITVIEGGVPFTARVVSEGTLRVLGLLAITNRTSPTTLVAYEEPENGVHARRLRLVAELLTRAAETRRIQLIVNTHSSILPAYMPQATLFACERRKGATYFRKIPAGLFAQPDIDAVLDENGYQERVLSGQFGG